MTEPMYDEGRPRRLVELLRSLAARIDQLTSDAELLRAGPELIKMMGDARSELFHYEVRSTYDTPQEADSRRIVEEARRRMEDLALGSPDFDPNDGGDDDSWQPR